LIKAKHQSNLAKGGIAPRFHSAGGNMQTAIACFGWGQWRFNPSNLNFPGVRQGPPSNTMCH